MAKGVAVWQVGDNKILTKPMGDCTKSVLKVTVVFHPLGMLPGSWPGRANVPRPHVKGFKVTAVPLMPTLAS